MSRGLVEVRVADAQMPVSSGKVGSPVALGTAKRLAEQRHNVRPVPVAEAGREVPAEFGVGEQANIQAVYGGLDGRPSPDGFVNARSLRFGRDGFRLGDHGHGCLLVEVVSSTIPVSPGLAMSNEYSLSRRPLCPDTYARPPAFSCPGSASTSLAADDAGGDWDPSSSP